MPQCKNLVNIDIQKIKELGPKRTVVSEAQLERNRQIHKDEYEKNKENIEKFEKMENELNLNKKRNTRDLARFR